jgi:hypothetical protein
VKSWTLEAPGWTMRGPPIFFPCNSFKIYISPKAIISVFYSRCKFKKQIFCDKKIARISGKKNFEQKNAGRLLVAPTSFLARNFMSSGSFPKIKSNIPLMQNYG